MVHTIPLRQDSFAAILAVPLLGALVSGCAAPSPVDPDPARQSLLRVQPSESVHALRLEDPGIIIVQDGTECGRSAGGGEVVALEGSFELLGYANAATVFLNGWRLEYLQSDHEVTAISADIREITLAGDALTWLARGHSRDHNFDDATGSAVLIPWSPGTMT